jgi:hypothetical protein
MQVRKLGCWHQSEDRVLYSNPLLILVLQILMCMVYMTACGLFYYCFRITNKTSFSYSSKRKEQTGFALAKLQRSFSLMHTEIIRSDFPA